MFGTKNDMSTFGKWTEADVAKFNARALSEDARDNQGFQALCQDEAELHIEIIAELKRRGSYFVHSRMDRATTQAKGVPDFIIAIPGKLDVPPRTLWIEAKGRKTKITPEQAGALAWLDRDGHETAVVRSLAEFLEAIK